MTKHRTTRTGREIAAENVYNVYLFQFNSRHKAHEKKKNIKKEI